MKISFIGSGNVATHLAHAFYRSGMEIVQVHSRNFENASALATSVKATPIINLKELIWVDVLVLSLSDSAYPEILTQISQKAKVIVHTSGTLSLDILENTSDEVGVFYPLQTFSKSKPVNWSTIPICIEASSPKTQDFLISLANSISDQVVPLDSTKRKALHVAAVFACNFTNHLYHLASKILEENGLSFELMKPLIAETAEKINTLTPDKAQTGPAFRNDEQILATHMQYLENNKALQAIYSVLSNSIKSHKK